MQTLTVGCDRRMLNRVGGVGKLRRTGARRLVRFTVPNSYAPFIGAESYQFSAGEKRGRNTDALDSFHYGVGLNVDYAEGFLVGCREKASVGAEEYKINI